MFLLFLNQSLSLLHLLCPLFLSQSLLLLFPLFLLSLLLSSPSLCSLCRKRHRRCRSLSKCLRSPLQSPQPLPRLLSQSLSVDRQSLNLFSLRLFSLNPLNRSLFSLNQFNQSQHQHLLSLRLQSQCS